MSTSEVWEFRLRQIFDQKGLRDKFTLGADAQATAGPVGRTASMSTDAMLHAGMLSWSRSKG